jgi:DNA invertase Pin-like site-specific DNA recombinase
MSEKIKKEHLEKMAYCYIRQSTPRQVLRNRGSTELQYALGETPKALGWEQNRIVLLDRDLGLSGTDASHRHEFQNLLAEIVKGKVGAVVVWEISRLDRSNLHFHHFIRTCQYTNTLIIDRESVYDPNSPADQLVLGIKGAMAQAELQTMRARMEDAKIHKAKKGELRYRLPIGFCYDGIGRIILDPNEEVRHAIRMLFNVYKGVSSADDIVKYYHKQGLTFPTRIVTGPKAGQLEWKPLTRRRAYLVVKNPLYAGAYVYGRHKTIPKIDQNGSIASSIKTLPLSEWEVLIQEHHEGYITWNEFLLYQKKLNDNDSADRNGQGSAVRKGSALVQGILFCSKCGRTLSTKYIGDGGRTCAYRCIIPLEDGTFRYCSSFRAQPLDEAITQRILAVMKHDQLKMAFEAVEDWEKTRYDVDRQWLLKLDRAKYVSSEVERRYKQVDPGNRAVAANLEREWNDALVEVSRIEREYEDFKTQQTPHVTQEEKEQILSLSRDVKKLWYAPTTTHKDRKQLLRLLIKDIVIEKKEEVLFVHIRWQGGKTEGLEVQMPPVHRKRTNYSKEFVDRLELLAKDHTDKQIAEIFNKDGLRATRGGLFSQRGIQMIRLRYGAKRYNLASVAVK